MKTFKINIATGLNNVTLTVKNGKKFQDEIIKGSYSLFQVEIAAEDIKRVKQFAVKNGNDNSSNGGKWYAHCNGFAMGLFINYAGDCQICSYRFK